jgi:hypothetical protein
VDARDEIIEYLQAGFDVIFYCPTNNEMEYCSDLFSEESMTRSTFGVIFFDVQADEHTLDNVLTSKSNKVFVKNFTLYPEDIDGNLEKIQKIIRLLRSSGIQVIIPIFQPLQEIIEYYEEKYERLSVAGDESSKKTRSLCKRTIDLLNEIVNCTVPLYLPLRTGDDIYPFIDPVFDTNIKNLIKKEFKVAEYFKGIENSIFRYYKKLTDNRESITEEKIIFKIRELSWPFYNKLLQSCSRKERFVLYDMAQDMLVNANNLEAINSLLKRGLLVYDGTFKLMNESFRDFILTVMNRKELELYISTISPKWRSYKMPLFLIAMGVAVFFAFQEDFLGKVDALVTTAIGAIAIIARFSGLFFNSGKTGK